MRAFVSAVGMQVRFIEEPYLLCMHATGCANYASRVGRFVPGTRLLSMGAAL